MRPSFALRSRWIANCGIRATGPVAVAVGAEKHGLSQHLLGAAQHRVRIPMAGRADSLNVATSAAIVLYEAVRQRRGGPR